MATTAVTRPRPHRAARERTRGGAVVALALPLVLALVLSACIPAGEQVGGLPGPDGAGGVGTADGDGADGDEQASARRRLLQLASSCDQLLDHYIDTAMPLVGPWGLGGSGWYGGFDGDIVVEEAMDDSAGASETAAAPATGGGDAFSGTNTQESDVDEPDFVKTDGRLIVVASEGRLHIIDVASDAVIADLALPGDVWRAELLLQGDDLLMLSPESTGGVGPIPVDGGAALLPAFPPERTIVTRIDLSDPAEPRTVGSVRLEGSYASARMVDGIVRMVMRTQPTGLAFTQPADGGLNAEEEARERNEQLVAESDIDDWIPHLQVIDADGQAGEVQRLLDCTDVNLPREAAGLSTLSVVTFAMDDEGMVPASATGLVADGDTVYSSTDRLVVATSPWGRWRVPFLAEDDVAGEQDDEVHTDLHSFDISDPATVDYVGSGTVPGTLLNSFSVDEQDGTYRVATTTEPDWRGGEDSRSQLVVLTEDADGALQEVGRAEDLGVTERIYAVRYLSPDMAAVVTFRQVDPLYLLDTSDPTDPHVVGELKIPGYSAYLHPVGDGLLLGVGQDADEETGQTEGLQASLFDIRDPANPQRVSQVFFGGGYTPVEYDHKAFTFWQPTGQAFIPAELYDFDEEAGTEDYFGGVMVVDVDAEGLVLTEDGRLSNGDLDSGPGRWFPPAERTIVIGDSVWTLASGSLARHDLATLEQQAQLDLT